MTTSKKPTIIFDCDGVLLDWTLGFRQWMHYHKELPPEASISNYNMAEAWPGVSGEAMRGLIAEFNESPSFSVLPPIPGSKAAVNHTKMVYANATTVLLTCCGVKPQTMRGRLENLMGFEFDHCIILPLNGLKAPYIEKFVAQGPTVMIEDSPRYLDEIKMAGASPIMFEQPWNKEVASKYRHTISAWDDPYIYTEIIGNAFSELKVAA